MARVLNLLIEGLRGLGASGSPLGAGLVPVAPLERGGLRPPLSDCTGGVVWILLAERVSPKDR
jgi:hypothetical protein